MKIKTMNVQNLAFYIGKSSNKNVAIYSFNIDSGIIDLFNPLDTFWIMREQPDNPREELTYLEKTMAYGYETLSELTDSSNDIIPIKIKALPDDIIWIKRIDQKYRCCINISIPGDGDNLVFLKKVFVHVSGPLDNFVDSIDIIYEDPVTKKLQTYTRIANKSLS